MVLSGGRDVVNIMTESTAVTVETDIMSTKSKLEFVVTMEFVIMVLQKEGLS